MRGGWLRWMSPAVGADGVAGTAVVAAGWSPPLVANTIARARVAVTNNAAIARVIGRTASRTGVASELWALPLRPVMVAPRVGDSVRLHWAGCAPPARRVHGPAGRLYRSRDPCYGR